VSDSLSWQLMMTQSYPRATMPITKLLCFFHYCKTFSRIEPRFGKCFYLGIKTKLFQP
jgi:hypothetical protein